MKVTPYRRTTGQNAKLFAQLALLLVIVAGIAALIVSPFYTAWAHTPRDVECMSKQQDYDHDVEAQRDRIPGPHLLAMFARPNCVDNDGVIRHGE